MNQKLCNLHNYHHRYFEDNISLHIEPNEFVFLVGKSVDTIGNWGGVICMIQLVPLIGVIGPTEHALRKTFDKDGNRKKTDI